MQELSGETAGKVPSVGEHTAGAIPVFPSQALNLEGPAITREESLLLALASLSHKPILCGLVTEAS